jgi:hypothetical protein
MKAFANLRASMAIGCFGLLLTACGGSNPPPGGTGGMTSEGGENGIAGAEVGGNAGVPQGGMAGAGHGGGGRGGGGRAGRGGAGAGHAGAGATAGTGAIAGKAGGGAGGEGGTGGKGGRAGRAGGGNGGLGGNAGLGGGAGIAGNAGLGGSAGIAGNGGLGGSGAIAGNGGIAGIGETGGLGGSGENAGTAGTGATAGTGGQVDPCGTNNGGCDPLTTCTNVGGARSCSACPRAYTGTGESGCTPKLCNGAPDLDCACIKVTLDGNDADAIASHGLKPFHDVQLALDFAAEHPEVASKVCVVGRPDCSIPASADEVPTYSGPESGDFTMHDGVSLYGSYESTNFTRCSLPKTDLSLTSTAGVVFPNTITRPTVLDGFDLLYFEAPTSTAISVRGAKGVVVSGVQIEGGSTADDLYGIDVSDGAQTTLQGVAILMNGALYVPAADPSGTVYGVRAVGSQVTIDGCTLDLNGAEVYGVWLENAGNVVMQNSTLRSAGAGVGIHVEGSNSAVLNGTTLLGSMQVGAELIDTTNTTFSGKVTGAIDGLKALRSPVSGQVTVSLTYGTGVLLDTSPGSVLSVDASNAGQVDTIVSVVGDATGTQLGVTGDIYGVHGIDFSDCGGTAPLVAGSSLRIRGATDPSAISSLGDCNPRIENNPRLVAVAENEYTQIDVNAVHCGNGSRCSITNNPDIHVEVQQNSPLPNAHNLVGIRCDAGSCGDVIGNTVSALTGVPANNMTQQYLGVQGYAIVAGGGLVAKNVASAGCAVSGAGILASGGGLIENNFVYGPGCSSTRSGTATGSALEIPATSYTTTVDSNTLFGSAAQFAGIGSGAGWAVGINQQGAAIIRNNIIQGVSADFMGGTPSVFQNNDLTHSIYVTGTTTLTNIDLINALGPGFSANFAGSPGLAGDDRHLVANSPCVNAGTPEGAPADDFYGDPRDAQPDVGADEWNSVPPDPCLGVTCSGHGTCNDVQGAGVCTCTAGYLPPDCSATDLCATSNGGCDPLTTCSGFSGGRTCGACPNGYGGTGETGCCLGGTPGTACKVPFTSVVAADQYTCGLRSDGRITCFGRHDVGQLDAPSGAYAAIAGSGSDMCALGLDGTLACWGYHYRLDSSPRYFPPPASYQSVSVSAIYNCALASGTPACWGTMIATPPSGAFSATAVANWVACGLRPDGTVTCWSSGPLADDGQLNPPPDTFRALSINALTSCGLHSTDGSIACWGYDSFGVAPPSGSFKALSINDNDACALDMAGTIECWGHDAVVTAPPTGTGFDQVSVGGNHACALQAGNLYCWGDNLFGQLTPPY